MKKRYLPIRIIKDSITYEFKDFIFLICSFVFQSIVFSISPYLIELFINSIHEFLNVFILSFISVSLILILKPIANYFNVLIINVFSKKMRMHFENFANRKIALYSSEDFENIESTKRIHLSIEGATSASLASISIPSILAFFIPYFIFLSIYFYNTKPIFGWIAIVVFVPILSSQCVRTILVYKLKKDIVQVEIKENYFRKILTEPDSLKEIRILQEENRFTKIYKECLEKISSLKYKNECKMMAVSLFCDLMSIVGLAGTLYLLVYSMVDKSIRIGAFIAILTSILEMFNWMSDLANYDAKDLFNRFGSIINYYDFIDRTLMEKEKRAADEIILKNVSYQYYSSDKYALDDINLHIRKNDRIAIVGKNGSGKSTLINLILGLYEPTKGTIKRVSFSSQNSRVTSVFQNYCKYKLSMETNITIGEEEKRSRDYLIKQLSEIQFNQQECTLETVLSSEFDGIDISKGQWQKIAILRGNRVGFDFIALDEPTSSIDPLQEANVINYFEVMTKESTCILVTHRLNAIRLVDNIIVLDKGKIVEQGTHIELLDRKELYYDMYCEQRDKFC